MTATVTMLPEGSRRPVSRRVAFRLPMDDLRFTLAEVPADATKFGLAQRFRDLAVVGLREEARYSGQFLPRPILYTTARAGLGTPTQRYRVTLPAELVADLQARSKVPYAARFLRLLEVGLLHEQALAAVGTSAPATPSVLAPAVVPDVEARA